MKFFIHKKIEEVVFLKAEMTEKISSLVEGVELVITEPFHLESVLNDPDKINQLLKFCTSKAISVHLPFYDLNLGSVDCNVADYSLEVMRKGIDLAALTDAQIAVAHLGYNVLISKSATEKWFDKFIEKKRELEKYATDKGVTVVWENTYEKDMAVFDRIIKVHPDTKLCLDVGHCNCFADFSAVEFLERYDDNVLHLHLHDNEGVEDSHLAPGKGNIDFDEIMDVIEKSSIEAAVFEVDFKKFVESVEGIKKMFFKGKI